MTEEQEKQVRIFLSGYIDTPNFLNTEMIELKNILKPRWIPGAPKEPGWYWINSLEFDKPFVEYFEGYFMDNQLCTRHGLLDAKFIIAHSPIEEPVE